MSASDAVLLKLAGAVEILKGRQLLGAP